MKTLLLGVSLVALSSGVSTAVIAQGATPPTASDEAIVEVIVTSQRREERLQEVPISITAFSAEELRRNDTNDVSRLDKFTPGFNFGKSGLESRPAMRGVRTENLAGNGDPTIGFYVDDIYQSRAVQAGQPFVDAKRVEVTRGPQGTLFGRNTYGGAVSVTTATPTPLFDYSAEAVFGNYDRKGVQGFINIPVNEKLGLRFAGARETRDGFVKNIAVPGNDLYDKDTTFFRATARWTPTENLEVVLRASRWTEGGSGGQAFGYKPQGGIIDLNSTQARFDTAGGRDLKGGTVVRNLNFFTLASGQRDGIADVAGRDLGVTVNSDPYTWQGRLPSTVDLEQSSYSAQIKWSNDTIFVRSITGYQDFTYDANAGEVAGPTVFESVQIRGSEAFSQEFQIGSVETKPLQWIVGAFYLDDQIYDEFASVRTDGTASSHFAALPSVKSYAIYAQSSYFIMPKLRLTAGARTTLDKKEFVVANYNKAAGVRTNVPGFTLAENFDAFTWRLGADYFATDSNMIYGSISTGFRSGGFNNTTNPLVNTSFEPETVTAYEIGSKNRFYSNTLQINAAIYRNDFRDLQVQNQFLIPGGATTLSAIRNAGKAFAQGLEVELIARPIPKLTLNATLNLVQTEYTQYITGAPPNYLQPPLNQISLAGNEIPYTPNEKVTFGARYDFDLGGLGTLTPSVNAISSGSYYNTDFNTVLDIQKAYTKYDLRLAWMNKAETFGVDVFVENAGDVAVKNRGVFGSQGLNASYETPRFTGIRLTAKR